MYVLVQYTFVFTIYANYIKYFFKQAIKGNFERTNGI